MQIRAFAALFLLASLLSFVVADIPVHCVWNDIKGDWTFSLTEADVSRDAATSRCAYHADISRSVTKQIHVRLEAPDVATNLETGARGFFTTIYDEGFEVVLGGNKYFAFFNFTQSADSNVRSWCDRTGTGFYHAEGINVAQWGCFRGTKKTLAAEPAREYNLNKELFEPIKQAGTKAFHQSKALVQTIADETKLWTATVYPELEGKLVSDVRRMAGRTFPRSKREGRRQLARTMRALKPAAPLRATVNLPQNFDWRNASGVNYVSPVRNQASCGSCYIFATMGMFEGRLRVESKLKEQTIFSPQDVVNCGSLYAQGCDGGFPYLVAKYAEDYGLVDETCEPYQGRNMECRTKASCQRRYATKYQYTGGFYGATDEQSMMEELYSTGPISVAFYVYRDFMQYRGGIYHHVKATEQPIGGHPEPFWEETNHAVLLVGWGEENGVKYWICKNSWSSSWGEQGYFRILRGVDEVGIESEGVGAVFV